MSYIIFANGVRPPTDTVQPILEYPLPKTAQGLRGFLGMFDFYRRFIKHASELEAPLHNALSKPLLKGSQPITCSSELENCFIRCRDSIATAIELTFSDGSPFRVFY